MHPGIQDTPPTHNFNDAIDSVDYFLPRTKWNKTKQKHIILDRAKTPKWNGNENEYMFLFRYVQNALVKLVL